METIIFIKKNIKQKKGTYVSVFLLMFLVSLAFTMIISIRENTVKTAEKEMEYTKEGNISVFVKNTDYSEELMAKVLSNNNVQGIEVFESVVSENNYIKGNEKDTDKNAWFIQKMEKDYKVFNKEITGYDTSAGKPQKGEMYLPLGLKPKIEADVGDVAVVTVADKTYEFIIKGFMVEPVNGAQNMGWKNVFISDDDYEKIKNDAVKKIDYDKNQTSVFYRISIIKQKESELTDEQFAREINLKTGIINMSTGSLTKEQSIGYTTIFPEIVTSILLAFSAVLLIVLLIVTEYTIKTSMEMEYTKIGIMKSMGFTAGKIRKIYILSYLAVQIPAAVVGIIFSSVFTNKFQSVFMTIMSMKIDGNILLEKSIITVILIMIFSVAIVFLQTKKVKEISVVNAIQGGRKEVFFKSRFNVEIRKKILLPTMAFRRLTSDKKQYVGIFMIVSILVFFMMTILFIGNALGSKTAAESMGLMYENVSISLKKELSEKEVAEIEDAIEEFTKITKKVYSRNIYLSVEGEQFFCTIYEDTSDMGNIIDGRVPLYENEISVTQIVADRLSVQIGDMVNVSFKNESRQMMITGLMQDMRDVGLCISMNSSAAFFLENKSMLRGAFSLRNEELSVKISDMLNERFSDKLKAESYENGGIPDTYVLAVTVMRIIVYIFSMLFVMIVIIMVCRNTFQKERTDIGIYKALGFTSKKLRMMFALRFLIMAFLGAVFGAVLSVMFSEKLIEVFIVTMGITRFKSVITLSTVIIPTMIVCVSFFVFSYMASREVKNVEIKELVIE